VPEPLTEHPEIKADFRQGLRIFISEDVHLFTLAEATENFTQTIPSAGPPGEAA
jgi:hypothetical protein